MSFRFTAQICWTDAHVRDTLSMLFPSSTISSLTSAERETFTPSSASTTRTTCDKSKRLCQAQAIHSNDYLM